ncbi:electron transfer flavoprotein subunit beta/FixA family protein [Arthrobacter sp. NPDC080031]|uniref:electron transfer flavoprotein subunit beta/FixA family protein n=1 Tax=Arthrobacter sp. NPDC080031 TaxID=3155918 RepID=UPI00344F7485
MKIIVLIKQVPDTWSTRRLNLETGMLDRAASDAVPDEINERSLENALQYKDAEPGTEIVVLSMGTEDTTKTLRKMLSLGADSAVLVADPALAGSDMVQTTTVLAAAVSKIGADLVLAGNEATDGAGGVVPAMLAEILGHPLLPSLESISITGSSVTGSVQVDGGSLKLSAPLPAVASVTEKSAEARLPNFKSIMQAKKKPLDTWSLQDLGIEAGPESATVRCVMVSATERPPKKAGPKITDDGTAAAELADFLVQNRLL